MSLEKHRKKLADVDRELLSLVMRRHRLSAALAPWAAAWT